jgi:hypothetical protein
MTEPQEDPRIRETEPSTQTLNEAVSEPDRDGVGERDVESVTNSSVTDSGDDERGEP